MTAAEFSARLKSAFIKFGAFQNEAQFQYMLATPDLTLERPLSRDSDKISAKSSSSYSSSSHGSEMLASSGPFNSFFRKAMALWAT